MNLVSRSLLVLSFLAGCSSTGVPGSTGVDTGSDPATCGDVVEHPHDPAVPVWSYHEAANGPDAWGSLEGDALCADGVSQTPIDLVGAQAVDGSGELAFLNYDLSVPLDLLNNGHTLQVNYTGAKSASDPQITFGGETYWLLQFHAHSESEHTIDGVHSPFELHFVHQSASGGLAVVGVLMDEGAPDPALEQMFAHDPGHEAGVTCEDAVALDAEVPPESGFYHYSGSLTTPPCSEGVEWFVLDQHGTVSAAQVEAWAAAFEGTTNRPVQPLNGRQVGAFGI